MSSRRDRVTVAVLGTATLHVALAVGLALIEVEGYDWILAEEAPQLEMVDLELPEPPAPEIPEPELPQEVVAEEEVVEEVKETRQVTRTRAPSRPAPATSTHAATSSTAGTGGETGTRATIKMDLGDKGRITANPGKQTRQGRGTGEKGRGKESGPPPAPAPPKPASVSTLKRQAKPKPGFGYIDAHKDYPAEARRLEIEGKIRVRLVVDARGKVTKATLVNRLGHGLDELALERAPEIEFEPAIDTNDNPVASQLVWTFNFTLPD